MQHDRRRSAHTVRAYLATAYRFVDFLGRYRGEQIGRFALLALNASDLRAFLAERRASGLGPSSAARELSAVRAFLNYAAEQEGQTAQLPRTRAPKRPRTLPRPASPDDAMGLAQDAAAGASAEWIGARDLAILLLLYGAGLRVAEALSLDARVLPVGAAIRVTGKRSKTRVVPIVPAVAEAITEYARQCPYPLTGDGPLFVGRGRPIEWGFGAARGALGAAAPRVTRQSNSARIAAQLCHHLLARGADLRALQSCSVMPACRRPRSTPRSMQRACSMFTHAHPRA